MERQARLMYSVDKQKQLKDFAEAVAVPVGLTDSAKWPVRAGTVIFPVRNILVREFLEQVEASGILGYPDKWRAAFDGPTQLWRTSHHLLNGLMDDGFDKSVIASKILVLIEGIAALNNGHYFERLGKHIMLDDADVQQAVSVDMIEGKTQARKALMLAGLLWSYSETNFFVAHELTCEYHGPYVLADGTYAVIREFKNLKPTELWENRDYNGLPEYIRVITIHNNTLEIGFDAYNNLYDEKGTMAASLLRGCALADGHALSEEEISDLIAVISEKVESFAAEVNAMDSLSVARKYMEVFWYRKKSLTDYMGISWKPAKELYTVLEEGLKVGPKKPPKKTPSGRTPVEELAELYDCSADYKPE